MLHTVHSHHLVQLEQSLNLQHYVGKSWFLKDLNCTLFKSKTQPTLFPELEANKKEDSSGSKEFRLNSPYIGHINHIIYRMVISYNIYSIHHKYIYIYPLGWYHIYIAKYTYIYFITSKPPSVALGVTSIPRTSPWSEDGHGVVMTAASRSWEQMMTWKFSYEH